LDSKPGVVGVVAPGDFLCYSEEFFPASGSANAFEDKEGKVFSSVLGCEKRDVGKRSIAVASQRVKRPLKAGDLVYARVDDLYDTVALTRMKPIAPNIAPQSDSAFLRISEIRRAYLESFRDSIGIGDILVARIKEVTPLGIYLTVIENDLGVFRAFCSTCRKEMILTPKGFYCKSCGAGEDRKTPAPGTQPTLFVEPPAQSERDRFGGRDSRGGGDRRGPPRGGFGGGGRDRGERGGGDRRGPPRRDGFRGGGERGGDRRGPPRRDGFRGGGGRDRGNSGGGGRRDSRGPRGKPRNIGSYYPAG